MKRVKWTVPTAYNQSPTKCTHILIFQLIFSALSAKMHRGCGLPNGNTQTQRTRGGSGVFRRYRYVHSDGTNEKKTAHQMIVHFKRTNSEWRAFISLPKSVCRFPLGQNARANPFMRMLRPKSIVCGFCARRSSAFSMQRN